jgi:Glycosyl transferase family 2
MPSASPFPIGSVAIPAHNEAEVIRRCLDALLTGLAPGELEVVVSCNGCTDDTADIVRSYWPEVRVIDLVQASKPAALNAADEALAAFPRIYLDADVILPARSARILIKALQTGSLVAATPTFRYDTSHCDRLVCGYYRARLGVIAGRKMLHGGAYGLSRSGRSRFGAYPEVTADDGYADEWFEPSEIEVVDDAPAIVTVPRGIRELFHVLRRRRRGHVELQSLPGGRPDTGRFTLRSLMSMAVSGPRSARDALIFAAIATAVRVSVAVFSPTGWSRDESSRTNMTMVDAYNKDPEGYPRLSLKE